MADLTKGIRIVEGGSFVAAPSCGLHLLLLGADVSRFDAIGGGPDTHRWPRAPGGASFHREGLNKGERSVVLDLARPELLGLPDHEIARLHDRGLIAGPAG